ncbi:MAG: hypothetical protein J6B01_11790 [Ruminococcus sp.]|nr:hypothetical protein [Ruminococcus sp.]MBQ4534999.1 hypothetical protein [Ruminococcus sp.]
MENFRKKLQTNNKIKLIIILLSIICLVILNIMPELRNDSTEVFTGFFTGLTAVLLINFIRNKRALNDEKLLKSMYIRNTDERNNQMMKEVSKTTFTIIIAGISIATIVSSYFSEIVSSTLSCCMAFILIVYFCVTAYYNKKM